ncbi:D-glycero-beta-D-manno-heptose 1,7-bisphosphate 7-phosphatase [Chitinibacteraceae bacterium HSL-7]
MPAAPMKLLILDRDGVINHDSPDYIKAPDEWLPIDGSLEAISALNHAGWSVVIATNQSAVGRGMIDVDGLNAIHAKMYRALAAVGGHVDAVFFCPHDPKAGCDCRKPAPGMVLDIARRYRVGSSDLVMVGDSWRDLEAVTAAGGRGILVRTGNGQKTEAERELPPGTLIFDDLAAVARHLLAS